MGAEGIMDVNLFEFSDEDVPDENNAADKGKGSNTAGENLAKTRSDGSDGDETNNSIAAVPFMAVPGGSGTGTNAPLPKPPAAGPGAKIDTSQLDAELAKMNADALKNAQIPSPPDASAANPPAPSIPTEQRISTMSTNDANEEISDEAKTSDEGNNPNDDNNGEAFSENDGEIGASPVNDGTENPDAAAEVSNGGNAPNDDNNGEAFSENDGGTGDGTENPDAAAENNPQDSIGSDPNFAHKTSQDLHANTTPPQTHIAPAEHVPPLTAQNVDYHTPTVPALEKHPEIPKKQTQNGPITVEKMPIILTFETGRQKITIGELEKIREGYTFECGNPTNAPVTICANDTPIGTGELLDVDGRIGVRIIEFYNK